MSADHVTASAGAPGMDEALAELLAVKQLHTLPDLINLWASRDRRLLRLDLSGYEAVCAWCAAVNGPAEPDRYPVDDEDLVFHFATGALPGSGWTVEMSAKTRPGAELVGNVTGGVTGSVAAGSRP